MLLRDCKAVPTRAEEAAEASPPIIGCTADTSLVVVAAPEADDTIDAASFADATDTDDNADGGGGVAAGAESNLSVSKLIGGNETDCSGAEGVADSDFATDSDALDALAAFFPAMVDFAGFGFGANLVAAATTCGDDANGEDGIDDDDAIDGADDDNAADDDDRDDDGENDGNEGSGDGNDSNANKSMLLGAAVDDEGALESVFFALLAILPAVLATPPATPLATVGPTEDDDTGNEDDGICDISGV